MSNSNSRKAEVDDKTKHIIPAIKIKYEMIGVSSTPNTPPNTPASMTSISYPASMPSSPETPSLRIFDDTMYSVEQTLKYKQYEHISKIANTLQGSIWQVSKNGDMYIVKVTNKLLHKNHITNYNGQEIHISENVIKEASIVEYLTNNNPPKSLVKYIDFFCDEFNYMFVMQYGGEMSLFELVKDCHQYINDGIITLKEWHKFCRIAIRQMVHLIDWLHNSVSCCHLDISLENFVIDNVMVIEIPGTNTIQICPDFQIRIIDFGLAEVFNKKNECNEIDFYCDKFVGKVLYQAPEVYKKKEIFDSRIADCWSLGVVFFIMFIGCPPFNKPSMNDVTFNLIMCGHLDEILVSWGKYKTITSNIFSLLTLMFQDKNNRLTIKEIRRHAFLL